jgi:two-component system, chemotaxis family, chemotaxis protein CheY
LRALIVEDSKAIRSILKKYLAPEGVECHEAEHGGEALLRLGELGSVDVMLVDWNMPYLLGIDLVRIVRSYRKYDEIKIVMVTTETEMSQMEKALTAGANEYVMKPFTKDVILDKLSMMGLMERS